MSQTSPQGDDLRKGDPPLLRPTSRRRLWAFFALNLAGFVAVNIFWQYLCTGTWGNVSPAAYYSALGRPLGEMLLRPLDLFSHPWMMAVAGLLLGMEMFVPVIVSVLYRLRWGLLLAGVVALVGQAPFLALAVAAGCLLAARVPLRKELPFLACFAGLAPVAVYLFAFDFAGVDLAAMPPLQRWVLRIPLLIALVSAVVSCAAVLALARVTKFRPGVIWPVLAVFLAGPVLIFYLRIGPAEMDYAVIAGGLSSEDGVFGALALKDWQARHGGAGLREEALLVRLGSDLKDRRKALLDACRRFLRRYPNSRQAPGVLWIQGQCLDLQLDVSAFWAGQVRYVADYPLEQSAETWRQLRGSFPASTQSALAGWKLAVLALRKAQVDQADELLREAAGRLRESLGVQADQAAADKAPELFTEPALLPAASCCAEALFEVQRLLWQIKENRLLSDRKSAQAMADYLSVNKDAMTEEQYRVRLHELAGAYEDTELSENLKLAVAKTTSGRDERTNQMVALAEQRSDRDAAIEANYELAQLLIQEPVLQLRPDVEKPEVYLRRVVEASSPDESPPCPWRARAVRCREFLQTSTQPKEAR